MSLTLELECFSLGNPAGNIRESFTKRRTICQTENRGSTDRSQMQPNALSLQQNWRQEIVSRHSTLLPNAKP